MSANPIDPVISIVGSLGFPIAVALWALREMRQQAKDNSKALIESNQQFIATLKEQRTEYVDMIEKINGSYEALVKTTVVAMEKNTQTLGTIDRTMTELCNTVRGKF